MRALKGLVIGLALLIAIGLTVVVVTIVGRLGDGGSDAKLTPRAAFGKAEVEIPSGSVVSKTVVEGDRLLVYLRLSGGRESILVVDLKTGKTLGSIEFVPGGTKP